MMQQNCSTFPIPTQINTNTNKDSLSLHTLYHFISTSNNANWQGYAQHLVAAIKNMLQTAENRQFIDAIGRAARKNILCWCRRNYAPGMASKSVEMHEQYNYKHQCESDHFAKDTIQTGGADERCLRGMS